MILYQDQLEGIDASRLQGFFVGWPNPPTPETHMRLLHGSQYVWLAVDSATGNVVGFITALSDGVLSAYIPLLEVLPSYQKQGIGKELVQRMLATLGQIYMVDLLCDEDLQPYYGNFGMRPISGMFLRNYEFQSGKPE